MKVTKIIFLCKLIMKLSDLNTNKYFTGIMMILLNKIDDSNSINEKNMKNLATLLDLIEEQRIQINQLLRKKHAMEKILPQNQKLKENVKVNLRNLDPQT